MEINQGYVQQLSDKINSVTCASCWDLYVRILLRCTDPWTLNPFECLSCKIALPVETKWLTYNTGKVHITKHWDALVQRFLLWKRSNYYIFWVRVSSVSYPACRAHALCYIAVCVLFGLPYYLITCTILGESKLLKIKCFFFFFFCYNFCLKHFLF